MSLYHSDDRQAVMKLSFVVYDAKTGRLAAPAQTLVAQADQSQSTVAGAVTVAATSRSP